MSGRRFVVLGGGDGWHAEQLSKAASQANCEIIVASYESLASKVHVDGTCVHSCEAGTLTDFDAILTRTMPAGSLERITFRLAILHSLVGSIPIVNHPRGLEIAIDKFATLAHVGGLGYAVPETIVVQSRREAMNAFDQLGGDCVVKPIFGGEGRGVTRIRDRELAWYAFAALDQLDSVLYVQKFVSPGGADTRILVIGDKVFGIRRTNESGFRTNMIDGAQSQTTTLSEEQVQMAKHITDSIGLKFASVDVIDSDDGVPRVLEVNAIPGWRGAQSSLDVPVANVIVEMLNAECDRSIKHV